MMDLARLAELRRLVAVNRTVLVEREEKGDFADILDILDGILDLIEQGRA